MYYTPLYQALTINSAPAPRPFRLRTICQLLFWLMVFLGFTHLASAQVPSINWQKTLGGSGNDVANAMTPTADGGYVVVGSTDSNDGDVAGNHGGADFWIVKLDGAGNKIWQQTLGGSGTDIARAVTASSDGGYVVAGYTNSPDGDITGYHGNSSSNNTYDYWVVKLDRSGNLVWQKTLGGTGEDQANAITASSDGGFVVAGLATNNSGDVTGNHGDTDFWVVKLNGSGNIVWQKSLGGSNGEFANAITATSDGGCAVAGSTVSNDKDVTGYHKDTSSTWYWADYWIVKLDGAGNLVWQKTLGGTNYDLASAITNSSDGGFVIAGYTFSNDGDVRDNHGGEDFWVVKLNGLGNIVWQRIIGGSNYDKANAVTPTADGGYVVAGTTNSNPRLVIKTA